MSCSRSIRPWCFLHGSPRWPASQNLGLNLHNARGAARIINRPRSKGNSPLLPGAEQSPPTGESGVSGILGGTDVTTITRGVGDVAGAGVGGSGVGEGLGGDVTTITMGSLVATGRGTEVEVALGVLVAVARGCWTVGTKVGVAVEAASGVSVASTGSSVGTAASSVGVAASSVGSAVGISVEVGSGMAVGVRASSTTSDAKASGPARTPV